MAVDFSGRWKLYQQENAEDFLRAISAPEIYIKMMNEVKPLTTIQQNGDEFIICVKTPLRSITNSFSIGSESEFSTMDGQKIKVIHSNESLEKTRSRTPPQHKRHLKGQFTQKSNLPHDLLTLKYSNIHIQIIMVNEVKLTVARWRLRLHTLSF
ncbi:fatty acid-binding protein, liver isoform X1 [Carassius carassius]|uniref:fatty acid-binding protein, liver isoform X1 n=1 Tax=Carassius carassius TaxID=217509 RepID=UPI0028685FA7|nr:fatty acid-binding protein, liver isoform X1 [Carassius carassius]